MQASGASIDYSNPNVPRPIWLANRVLRPVASRLFPLDVERLMETARRRTRLDDFGAGHFREPLGILVDALEREAQLNPLGRFGARQLLLGLLETRLRVEDLLRRRPEILEQRIERPILIVGMLRTGTTLLHRLLAQDPGLRHLPYWESAMPLPLGDPTKLPPAPDPRIRRARQSLAFLYWVAPLIITMHELEAEAPDEELSLMAVDFATTLFEASYNVPSFAEWFARTDQTPAYAYFRRLLQILQWYRRGDRWLLKSPQHLWHLRALLSTFPDATIVQTHRDPVTVTASFASLTAYGRRMNTDHPDPRTIARSWAQRIEMVLRRSIEDRPANTRRFIDVSLHELMRDPIGVARRIYAVADRELTPAVEKAMRTWLAANPQRKHGGHVYRLEDFGLDREERRTALRFYQDRFNVPDDKQS
jgi:hypothetical protein